MSYFGVNFSTILYLDFSVYEPRPIRTVGHVEASHGTSKESHCHGRRHQPFKPLFISSWRWRHHINTHQSKCTSVKSIAIAAIVELWRIEANEEEANKQTVHHKDFFPFLPMSSFKTLKHDILRLSVHSFSSSRCLLPYSSIQFEPISILTKINQCLLYKHS